VLAAAPAAFIDNDQPVSNETAAGSASDVTIATTSSSTSSFDSSPPRPSLALRHLIRATATPSHVTVRTGPPGTVFHAGGSLPPAPRLVLLATIPVSGASVATSSGGMAPSSGAPSSVNASTRPAYGAAQRFRNMVLKCRDGE